MSGFLADENVDNRILRGLRRENARIDIVRVQDTELFRKDDETILEWAAKENRVLITYDVNTVIRYAYERVAQEKPMPGVIALHSDASIGTIIDDLLVMIGATEFQEFENQVIHLPL